MEAGRPLLLLIRDQLSRSLKPDVCSVESYRHDVTVIEIPSQDNQEPKTRLLAGTASNVPRRTLSHVGTVVVNDQRSS